MTDETKEEPISRPSGAIAPRETSVMAGRKRVIMTKKLWSAEDIRRLFRTLDQDSSGRLSLEEFSTGLKELGFEMKDDAAKALYRKMDVDGDGRITEGEFVKLMRNMNRDKLTTQLSSLDRVQSTSTKKPKKVDGHVYDIGYHNGAGQFKEFTFSRADIHEKYVKEIPQWKRHCRWIDLYGTDETVMEFVGNECELSSRMVDECTCKHAGKVQYSPDEPALFVVGHALFLTKRPTQEAAMPLSPFSPASPPASPTKSSSGATLAIPLGRLGRRSSIVQKKQGFGNDEDDEAEDDEAEEKKDEPETQHELLPERFYESPKVNMSQIVIVCLPNTIITIRRRSNHTPIQQIFNVVQEDLNQFLTQEIRSSLEAPSSRDLLLSFLHELNEYNHTIRSQFSDWKLVLEKDINKNLRKYHSQHLHDLNLASLKSVQILEPFTQDLTALNGGDEEETDSDAKAKLSRQTSVPTTGEEKKKKKMFASAQQFIGDKKAGLIDAADASQRLLSQLKYAVEASNSLGTHYKHQMDDRQSKSLNYLTVITGTIFPMQLMTGVYGMNFEVLPELTWEYSYLLFWLLNLLVMALLLKFWHSRGFF